MADKYGEIDCTPAYISSVTGLLLAEVEGCLARFLEPDEYSRTQTEDGRRLVLIDANRPWGWRIVNHGKYKEKARLASKNAREVESGENAARLARPPATAEDRRAPPPTASHTHTHTQTQTKIKNPPTPLERKSKKRKTPIPADFALDDSLSVYATQRLPDVDVRGLLESFGGKARAKGWEYVDWRHAFQEFVRNAAPGSGHFAAGQYPRLGAAAQRWEPPDEEDLHAQA